MKKLLLVVCCAIVFSGCGPSTKVENLQLNQQSVTQQQTQQSQKTVSTQPAQKGETMEYIPAKTAIIKTSKGDVTIELYPDEASNTVQNFLQKAKSGYYKNLTFHRVESWVVQGGDPLGNGTGGGKMATELSQRKFEIGSVGVARGGDINVSNDSQFFICTDDCSWLTGQYTNFGKVTKGMDIVKKIQVGDKIVGISY